MWKVSALHPAHRLNLELQASHEMLYTYWSHYPLFLLILAYFPHFEKISVGLWDHHDVYASVYPLFSTFECVNQSLWNLVHIQGDSGGVTATYGARFWRHFEQKVSYKHGSYTQYLQYNGTWAHFNFINPSHVCICMCIPKLSLDNSSIKTLPQQQ
jgi:hypothetical protein